MGNNPVPWRGRCNTSFNFCAFVAPVAPDLDPGFTWPYADEIAAAQACAAAKTEGDEPPRRGFRGIHVNEAAAVWIPCTALQLQIRICIIAHCGSGNHRGYNTTLRSIKEHFYWNEMDSDVLSF